jgi:hypothetical protein
MGQVEPFCVSSCRAVSSEPPSARARFYIIVICSRVSFFPSLAIPAAELKRLYRVLQTRL